MLGPFHQLKEDLYCSTVGLLRKPWSTISSADWCLRSTSSNIWGAHVGLNGGTGFLHKAAEGQSVGGRFNSSVNNIRRSHLCRLSKQRVAERLWRRFLERCCGFLRTANMLPTSLGHWVQWFHSNRESKIKQNWTLRSDATTRPFGQEWKLKIN